MDLRRGITLGSPLIRCRRSSGRSRTLDCLDLIRPLRRWREGSRHHVFSHLALINIAACRNRSSTVCFFPNLNNSSSVPGVLFPMPKCLLLLLSAVTAQDTQNPASAHDYLDPPGALQDSSFAGAASQKPKPPAREPLTSLAAHGSLLWPRHSQLSEVLSTTIHVTELSSRPSHASGQRLTRFIMSRL